MNVSCIRMAWQLLLVATSCIGLPRAAAQLSSWDEPRHEELILDDHLGVRCVKDELLVVLEATTYLEEFRGLTQSMGDRIAGFVPSLAAARLVLVSGADLNERIDKYSSLEYVRFAEPNFVASAIGLPDPTFDDPGFPDQWHLENTGQSGGTVDADIDAPEAWQITRGSPTVTVAVIDTGIDLDSPEFSGRLLPGWDFVSEDAEPQAGSLHGTYIAGLLCANSGNAFEVVGLDHRCMILPIKAGGNFFDEFDVVQSVDYGAAEGADVISMSLGFGGNPQLLKDAVAAAVDSGVIIVAAAGNSGSLIGSVDKTWPAASPKTISIGWTDHNDVRSDQSSNGNALDFVAPGVEVITVSGNASGQPKEVSGSSAATPLVSALVALMKSLNSTLTYEQVYDFLIAGAADELGDPLDTPGWDPWYGHGRVNAYASLQALCGCTGGERLIASPQTLKSQSGGVIEFVIDFGRDFAHAPYLILGSATPGTVGYSFGGALLRLTPDSYFQELLGGSDGVALIDTSGFLDANGRAHAMIIMDALPGLPTDVTLHHQAVVLQGGHTGGPQVELVSNKTKTVIQAN